MGTSKTVLQHPFNNIKLASKFTYIAMYLGMPGIFKYGMEIHVKYDSSSFLPIKHQHDSNQAAYSCRPASSYNQMPQPEDYNRLGNYACREAVCVPWC